MTTRLDQRDGQQSNTLAPCILCHRPVITRSPRGKPCHWSCATAWADEHQDQDQGCLHNSRAEGWAEVATRPGGSYCWLVYEHDPDEVEVLGWEEFIARQWESIFIGYRSWVGRRSMGRRWSDLFEAGLSCSQEIAGRLARAEIMDRADRDLEGAAANVEALVSGMIGVVAALRADLVEMGELGADLSGEILDQHTRLLSFVRAYASDH
jgi:hypothetical protein